MPVFLFKIAMIVILVRSVYVAVQTYIPRKKWLEVAFHVSIAVAALYFIV